MKLLNIQYIIYNIQVLNKLKIKKFEKIQINDLILQKYNKFNLTICDLVPDVSVFGVFDGHGGNDVAFFVKRHFINELQRNENFKIQKFEDALQETFLKMDELLLTPEGQMEINQFRGEQVDVSQVGCTANVALFHKNILYVANAGDSRSILCRNNINYDMSHDHKPDNYLEKQRIERAAGYVSCGRICGNLNLSRVLGDLEYKKDNKLKLNEQILIAFPDIINLFIFLLILIFILKIYKKYKHLHYLKIELTQNDKFLLMGCDGIFDTLNHLDLLQFINQKLDNKPVTPQLLGTVVEDLLDHLVAPDTSTGFGCDNMTALIIYLK